MTVSKSVSAERTQRLLQAALSGMVAASAGACGEDKSASTSGQNADLSDAELTALCQGKVDDAVETARKDQDLQALCEDMVQGAKGTYDADKLCEDKVDAAKEDAKNACPKPDVAVVCNDVVKAAADKCKPWTATSEEKSISSEQKEYTFAALTKTCDDRGGYTQVHAACGGHNACAGFSFGDWGPDGAVLTEHSCAGANGCNGLSCVVLPKASERDGKELYEKAEYGDPGPSTCSNCHGQSDHDGNRDASVFKVYVFEGSTRTVDNWLERTAAEQERVVAFGAHGTLPDGTAYENMAPYHSVMARAEIERVVKHLRTLTPLIETIKVKDL